MRLLSRRCAISGAGVLREENKAAGMTAQLSAGMPASPMLEQLSTWSISTELGQSDWRISPYERNPPSAAEEGGELSSANFSPAQQDRSNLAASLQQLWHYHQRADAAQPLHGLLLRNSRDAAHKQLLCRQVLWVLCFLLEFVEPRLHQAIHTPVRRSLELLLNCVAGAAL